MPKILLIQPTQYSSHRRVLIKQKKIFLPGLVFPLLAALTPPHWEVETAIEVVDEINFDTDAALVGIGAMGHATFRGLEIADEFRRRGKTVFFGGYMASIFPDYVADHADGIIIGDAEIAYPKLLQDFEMTGNIEKVYHFPVDNLDNLPVPKYELLLKKRIGFMLPVQAARGCPHSCNFCSIACIYQGKHISRPAEEVMNDIKRVREMGFKMFYLIDDNLVGNPAYLEDLCSRIKPLKMKWASQCTINIAKSPDLLKLVYESGCRILSIGIETLNQEALNAMNKGWVKAHETGQMLKRIMDAGIMPSTEMIIGTDFDNENGIRELRKFVDKVKIPIPRFYILTPIPGTEMYREYHDAGRITITDFSQYNVTSSVFVPAQMSSEQLEELYRWLNRKIFSIPSILRRVVFNRYFLRRPFLGMFALAVNLQYRSFVKRGDAPNIL